MSARHFLQKKTISIKNSKSETVRTVQTDDLSHCVGGWFRGSKIKEGEKDPTTNTGLGFRGQYWRSKVRPPRRVKGEG